jgi:hypothetical protein
VTSRGIVRLLNTAGGRVRCLAGAVDEGAVEDFHHWYGREPARVDGIDAGSVTSLSVPGLELLLDHLGEPPVIIGRWLADTPTGAAIRR